MERPEQEITTELVDQLADDSIYTIEQIKSGQLTDQGGDLKRNADYLQFLLDNEKTSVKLTDKEKLKKAIQKAK